MMKKIKLKRSISNFNIDESYVTSEYQNAKCQQYDRRPDRAALKSLLNSLSLFNF